MKTRIIFVISIFCLLSMGNLHADQSTGSSIPGQETIIKLACTPELQPLLAQWAEKYSLTRPEINIEVDVMPEAGSQDVLSAHSGIFSTHYLSPGIYEQAWSITLGHDVIVPVINENNPFIDVLYQKGVRSDELATLLSGNNQKWGKLTGTKTDHTVQLYITDRDRAISSVGKFLDAEDYAEGKISLSQENAVLDAVRDDPFAIAFCRLGCLIDPVTQKLAEGIRFLPIDRNGNGRLDYMENIYEDINTVARGVWIGKYPRSLVSNIHFISESQPVNESEVAFLKWILSDGQSSLGVFGYNPLVNSERLSQLQKFSPLTLPYAPPSGIPAIKQPGWIIFAGAILLIILLSFLFRHLLVKKTKISHQILGSRSGFSESSLGAPGGLYFDRNHTWAFREKDGAVKVGIDDFLQHVVGKVTRLKMKIKGETVTKGEALLSIIQRGKRLTIYAPFSGVIREINEQLFENSSMINTSPYDKGWVYIIEPDNWAEDVKKLQTAEKYRVWLTSEFTRLKDFLAAALSNKQFDMSMIILQDGGEIRDSILAELGPETWEDFQAYFLDLSK
ncbi:MAG: hypothetical protein RQ761_05010 [Bacteroidales bacterium]|nr:hypothetical protein [Bacteroidales bacterium]